MARAKKQKKQAPTLETHYGFFYDPVGDYFGYPYRLWIKKTSLLAVDYFPYKEKLGVLIFSLTDGKHEAFVLERSNARGMKKYADSLLKKEGDDNE